MSTMSSSYVTPITDISESNFIDGNNNSNDNNNDEKKLILIIIILMCLMR